MGWGGPLSPQGLLESPSAGSGAGGRKSTLAPVPAEVPFNPGSRPHAANAARLAEQAAEQAAGLGRPRESTMNHTDAAGSVGERPGSPLSPAGGGAGGGAGSGAGGGGGGRALAAFAEGDDDGGDDGGGDEGSDGYSSLDRGEGSDDRARSAGTAAAVEGGLAPALTAPASMAGGGSASSGASFGGGGGPDGEGEPAAVRGPLPLSYIYPLPHAFTTYNLCPLLLR
jgi:hypothetical protein